MSLNSDRSTASRLTKEINNLRSSEAAEIKKEADATKKANAAHASASRASSQSSVSMYLNTVNREHKAAETAQQRRARYSNDIAKKSVELARVQDRIARDEESERKTSAAADGKRRIADEKSRKSLADANVKLRHDYESRVSNLEDQLTAIIEAQASSTKPFEITAAEGQSEPYDIFVSDASADKEEFVDSLVQKARLAGLRVWYDDFALEWGDSIRQKIDNGLRSTYFGVVVLSPNFFSRPWPNYELDGLIQRDLSGKGRILPIWHRLTQDDVERYAPSLAGRIALSTSSSTSDSIVEELARVLQIYKHAQAGKTGVQNVEMGLEAPHDDVS